MRDSRKIEEFLRKKGGELTIPETLEPKKMRKFLEEYEERQKKEHQHRKKYRYTALKAAACFCLAAGILFRILQAGYFSAGNHSVQPEPGIMKSAREQMQTEVPEEERELLELSERSYEEIYACLSGNWKIYDGTGRYSAKEELAFAEREASLEDTASAADAQKLQDSEDAYGRTNVQTEQVDEADQVKNDGRYLYQIARKQEKEENGADVSRLGIQILDTKGGLREAAFLDGFESLEEFYVWEDLLITIENKYYDVSVFSASKAGSVMEDAAVCGSLCIEQGYHEISFYRISDKSRPRKLKTFTLQGVYESSRISEGYFYGFSRFTAGPGEGAQDYDAYIPSLDGERMEAERIYCPPGTDSTDYLVLVSIDLSDPFSFTDSRAVLAGSGTFYVSRDNIYVGWYQPACETKPGKEGTMQDSTNLLRFSYGKGRFYAQAEGKVPGNIKNSFSMDEYGGRLRIVLTVQEYEVKEIRDDRTGESLGFDYGEAKETNALYILNPSLDVEGKVEGLAEGEVIRSARFLGDTGYFVTFRQTDPLFAVDLSDSGHPEVLGELKVSGFSEYLHFYGENMLLGIGMEAEEETGREQGMKLSMFDVSDPADLKEVSRFGLEDYNYSEALWDHRAVCIDSEENIIGFEAEGSGSSDYWRHYLVFSWKDGSFVQILKADTSFADGGYGRTRGTFIGETLYLLSDNGTVRAYDRNTGSLVDEI